MADLKISQLTGATTPLAGTEILPIVQSSTTKKVSVADLTAGRAVQMAGGSFTDNITQSTAGKGINFSANANAAGMTSELLNWYEEGTFTATLTGSTTAPSTPITVSALYTRVGRIVTCQIRFANVDTTGASGNIQITGLPFTSNNSGGNTSVNSVLLGSFGATAAVALLPSNSTTVTLYNATDIFSPISMSAGTGRYLFTSITYIV